MRAASQYNAVMPIPPPQSSRTKCPYTLTQLSALSSLSDEHIVPEAIGGTLGFAFKADTGKNSWLGSEVDAPLINAPTTKMLLVHHTVRHNGLDPKAVLPGVIDGTDVRVEAILKPGAVVETHVRDKVKYDVDPATGKEDRTKGTIYGLPEEADAIADNIKRNRRDGKDVRFDPARSIVNSALKTNLILNTAEVRRGLYKIAYGALYWFLGDPYLDDAMIPDWQKMLFAPDLKAADASRISELLLKNDADYRLFLPPIKPHEHAISVARLGDRQVIATVGLFGAAWPYRAAVVGSVTDTYGLDLLGGWTAIIDAPKRHVRFEPFVEHFEREADRRAALPIEDPEALPPLPETPA